MYEIITEGMSCGHCVNAVTQALKGIDPTAEVKVELSTQKITVETTEPREGVESALEEAGYPALSFKSNA